MANSMKKRMGNFIPEEIPELITPHIELCSQKRAVVEGCKGVLQYDCDSVRLNCKTVIVSFSGENLSLCTLNDESITVTGRINDISFI